MAQGPVDGTTETSTARPLDFEAADIEAVRTSPPQFMLVVTGETPCLDVTVELVPRTYAKQPDYWGIEVVGRSHDQHVRRPAPYTASLLLSGVTGSRGIEVIGSETSVRLDVPDIDTRTS